ncbi:uncharacterized protein [Miscanthus floridulus]|uniref:uncharacterized protein n=1 Tax=Miscanthus floridulus TaxID=154761 RepID=UPI00345A5C6A
MAEVRAPGTTEAVMIAARPLAPEMKIKAAEASVAPLVQVHPISSNDTSWVWEAVDTEVAGAVEQPVPTSVRGSSAIVRVRPEPHGWDHPHVWWQSWDDPKGEPLFTLEDAAEGRRWDTFEQYRQLAEWSLWTAMSVVADDLPGVAQELETRSLRKSVFLWRERDIWDQLQRQKGLLADANELLAARSAEVEDFCLRCADAKVEAATAQEQVAPLAARVKEFEEELTRVAGERDTCRSWAREAMASGKVLAGQLGVEQSAHQLTKGALDEALTVAKASRTEAVIWRGKAEELVGEASRVAEASRVEAQRLKEKAEASRVEAQRWKEKAEACQVEAQCLEQKAKDEFYRLQPLFWLVFLCAEPHSVAFGAKLEKEVTQAAEASAAVQAVLETEIEEHDALKSAARTAYEALEVEGV